MAECPAAIFDRRAVRRNRERAMRLASAERGVGDPDFLHREIADRLCERLDEVRRAFPVAVDLGARGDEIARRMATRPGTRLVCRAAAIGGEAASPPGVDAVSLVTDEEWLPFADSSLDLILSCLSLHWVDDLPGTLVQINRALRPDGLFLAALFGGETLADLRRAFTEAEAEVEGGAGPRVSPFVELRDAGALLQRGGFALPMVDRDPITVSYAHALDLMRDLRLMGESNALAGRRRHFSRRETFLRAAEIYARQAADPSGRIEARFEVIYLTGWAPDASQPRPLRPGEASTRLADALGAVARPLDDDTGPGRR